MRGVYKMYFDTVTEEQLQKNKKKLLELLSKSTAVPAYTTIFYCLAYGTPTLPHDAEISCSTRIRGGKLTITLYIMGEYPEEPQVLHYADSTNLVGVVEYMYAWLIAYCTKLRLTIKVQQIQQYHDTLLSGSHINYSVQFAAGVHCGLQTLTDDIIIVSVSDYSVANIITFMQKATGESENVTEKQADQLKELYVSTFEACIHPIELTHTCNAVAELLHLHTRQVYSNVLLQACPRRLRALKSGRFFVQGSTYAAIIDLIPCAADTEESESMNADDKTYVGKWVVAPINNNGTRINITPKQACMPFLQ